MIIDTQYNSKTYKIRTPNSDHAVYFTIVNDSDNKPIAFFIDCKEMRSFEWITALMVSYSKRIKSGTLIDDIIEDMIECFDPNGGYIVPDGSGQKVNGIVHHLGLKLKQHIS